MLAVRITGATVFRVKIDWLTRRHLFARTCTCIRLIIYCSASIECTIKRTRSGARVLCTRARDYWRLCDRGKKKKKRREKTSTDNQTSHCVSRGFKRTKGKKKRGGVHEMRRGVSIRIERDDARFTLFKRRPYRTHVCMRVFRKHAHRCRDGTSTCKVLITLSAFCGFGLIARHYIRSCALFPMRVALAVRASKEKCT
jgi:hypothetical protein